MTRQASAARDDGRMDDVQIGSALRRLRIHAGKRQVDVARSAGVSQSLISAIECGRLDTASLATVRRVFASVGARFDGRVLWRGAAFDHLIDERHARLVAASVTSAEQVAVGCPCRGQLRGVRRTWLDRYPRGPGRPLRSRGQEVKTELGPARRDDPEARREGAPCPPPARIGAIWLGARSRWPILVMPDTDRSRRQVRVHAPVLDLAFPHRGADVRRWLQGPVGPMSGILFVADMSPEGPNASRVGVHRVRVGSGRPRRVRSVADAASADVRDSAARRARPLGDITASADVRDDPTDRASAFGR